MTTNSLDLIQIASRSIRLSSKSPVSIMVQVMPGDLTINEMIEQDEKRKALVQNFEERNVRFL